jgi:hypothetical protein
MCAHGDTVPVRVKVDAGLSHSGRDEWKVKPIDRCISGLVAALQAGGIDMLGSCCGHGKALGEIVLADGRTLTVLTPVTVVPVSELSTPK